MLTTPESPEIVEMLIGKTTKEENLYLQDRSGCTALIDAANYNSQEIAEMLIGKTTIEENLYLRDSDGNTALMIAAREQNVEIAKMLIDKTTKEENLYLRNRRGDTALDIAEYKNSNDIVSLIETKFKNKNNNNNKNKNKNKNILNYYNSTRYNKFKNVTNKKRNQQLLTKFIEEYNEIEEKVKKRILYADPSNKKIEQYKQKYNATNYNASNNNAAKNKFIKNATRHINEKCIEWYNNYLAIYFKAIELSGSIKPYDSNNPFYQNNPNGFNKKDITITDSIDLKMILDYINPTNPNSKYKPFKTYVKFGVNARSIGLRTEYGFPTNAINVGGISKFFFSEAEKILDNSFEKIDFKSLLHLLHLSKFNRNSPITTNRYICAIYDLIVSNLKKPFELLQSKNKVDTYERTNIFKYIQGIIENIRETITTNTDPNKIKYIKLMYGFIMIYKALTSDRGYVDQILAELYGELPKEPKYITKDMENEVKAVTPLKKREKKAEIMQRNSIVGELSNNINLKNETNKAITDYAKILKSMKELLGVRKLRDSELVLTAVDKAYFTYFINTYYKGEYLLFWYNHYIPLKISKERIDLLIKRLTFNGMKHKDYEEGFIRLLKGLDDKELIKIHEFWIGSDIMQSVYKIKFYKDERNIIVVYSHTCFNQIDIPINPSERNETKIDEYLAKCKATMLLNIN